MTISGMESAIVRTVVYASLFDYPLTLEELHLSLLEVEATPEEIRTCFESSQTLRRILDSEQGFFFLKGRSNLIATRREREERSRRVLAENRRGLRMISLIPHSRLIALSGSVAHLNMSEGADIDLFIVTRGARVWSVACTILFLTKLLDSRRKLCFNFLISDQHLSLSREDIFTANQMIHLRPLIGEDVHAAFLQANPFIRMTYPNFRIASTGSEITQGPLSRVAKTALEWLMWPGPGQLQETLCRFLYSRYLRSRAESWVSPEEVVLERDFLKLHTTSHRREVLRKYEMALEEVERSLSRGLE